MRNYILTMSVLTVILLIGACSLPSRQAQSSASTQALFTKEEAVKHAIALIGIEAKTQVIDARLLRNEDANLALGSRLGYTQMKDYPYTSDTPTWAVTLFVEGGVSLIDPNVTNGVIFLLIAGNGSAQTTVALNDPQTNPDALRLRALSDLDGKLEIMPIPIPTQGPLPPTMTPVPTPKE